MCPSNQTESTESQLESIPEGRTGRLGGWLVFLLALGLGILLAQRTWLKLADVLVDYGRELYVPWRLSEGEALYRDIAYFNGPLSPYWNALWFRIFGTGYLVQVWVNLVLLGLFGWVLYRLLARLGSRVSAGLALLFALPVFLFAHNGGIANYNFVSPYSHEMTHGLLLALLALGAALRCDPVDPKRNRSLLFTGVLLGLLFLTKAEIFVAAALGIGVVLGGRLYSCSAQGSRWMRAPGWVLGSAITIPVIAFLLLLCAMPAGTAALGVLGSWTGILGSEVADLPFYQVGMGLDHPLGRLKLAGSSLQILALALAPGLVLDFFVRRGENKWLPWAIAAALAIATFLVWRSMEIRSERLAFPLQFVLALVTVVLGVRLFFGGDGVDKRLLAGRLGWVVFALALLAKMFLNVRFEHYGFALALPAMAVVFLVTTSWLPDWMRARGGSGLLVAASALGVFSAVAIDRWQASEQYLAGKVHVVGKGRDRLYTDGRGLFVQRALDRIEKKFSPEEELLVLPEGITLNYWSRRRLPTPYTNYMPPELILYGEKTMVEQLRAHPPAGVVIVHKDTSEYGFPLFGRDYAKELGRWVTENYQTVFMDRRGGPPLRPGTKFGVAIMRHR